MKREFYSVSIIGLCLLAGGAGRSMGYDGSQQLPRSQASFRRTFGGPGPDVGHAIQQTTDEGYIVTGITSAPDDPAWKTWMLKVSPEGEESWSRRYGTGGYDEGESIQQTRDGGYVIIGAILKAQPDNYDLRVIKTDARGNLVWEQTFGGQGWDWGHFVRQTPDGGYILAGWTDSYGSGGGDVWLLKLNDRGAEEWSRTYGGIDNDAAHCVQPTPDGGYILVGSTVSYGVGKDDLWAIKTDSTGVMQWGRILGGEGFDEGLYVEVTAGGSYIVLGSTTTYGAGTSDLWLLQFDGDGNTAWMRTFGGPDWDWGAAVHQAQDSGYILVGSTLSYGAGASDVWLVKVDSEGREEWNRTYGGHDLDFGLALQPTSDGGYIIAAQTYSFGAGESDLWLIKTDSQGLATY